MIIKSILKFVIVFISIGFIFISNTAKGDDGYKLLKRCDSFVKALDGAKDLSNNELAGATDCAGFMQGITSLNMYYRLKGNVNVFFCLPKDGVNNAQAARIVLQYLRDHPEKLHRSESTLTIAALMEMFSCPGK